MLFFVILAFGFLNVYPSVRCEEPRLVIFLSNGSLYAPAGKPFGLLCKAEASETFTNMKWINPRREIITEGTPVVKEFGLHSLKLFFAHPKVADSGTYECSALYRSIETLKVNITLTFYEDLMFEKCDAVQNLVVGRKGLISCRPPQPMIQWERNRHRLRSERLTVTPAGVEISSVTENDEGLYIINAFVPETGVDKYITIKVNVLMRPQIMYFGNVTREEGKTVELECKARGIPRPTLSIRKANSFRSLQDGQEERIVLEDVGEGEFRILRLRIEDLRRSDDGLYFCESSNVEGDTKEDGHIEVLFKPYMNLTPTTRVKSWSGNTANLSCVAEANPNAVLSWKFQNELIEPTEQRYKIYGGISYGSLLVYTDTKTELETFGTYTCEARNAIGVNSIDIYLEEATPPGQITQIVFDKVTVTSITFRFMGPRDTGGLAVTHYVMKYENASDPGQAALQTEWAKDEPYILSDLKPRAKYLFSVAARNQVGKGPWKIANYIMPEETVPEPPIVITKQETISDFSDRFEVRWEVPDGNGEPITRFEVRYFKIERGIGGWSQVDAATERVIRSWGSDPSYQLVDLHPDTFYKIEIRATNRIGSSPPESVVIRTKAK